MRTGLPIPLVEIPTPWTLQEDGLLLLAVEEGGGKSMTGLVPNQGHAELKPA